MHVLAKAHYGKAGAPGPIVPGAAHSPKSPRSCARRVESVLQPASDKHKRIVVKSFSLSHHPR